ncbi:hypothetical protein [Acetobacter sicerae]|uniref:hypothetical protein n=1 Tax=Acetobacter sicerae TaxID=85325 RepID=UPI00156A8DC4|nr:hypothetical protein [Acetobacter sicerae]NHN91392.1 hypothetical protein [Acetobacter sicerae]
MPNWIEIIPPHYRRDTLQQARQQPDAEWALKLLLMSRKKQSLHPRRANLRHRVEATPAND